MIKNLIDKVFFAAGVIVFLQLPHFITQYAQRLGGYVDAQQVQIAEYQSIANQHFSGDLQAYIAKLKSNDDPVVAEAALQMEHRLAETQDMQVELDTYENEATWYLVPYFLSHPRLGLIQGTFHQFQPGLPINVWAWLYGLLGGVLFSVLFHCGCHACVKLIRPKSKTTAQHH